MNNNTSESQIQKQIQVELSKRGCTVFRMQSGKFLTNDGSRIVSVGVKGMSDLLCILPDGKTAWIETKRASGGTKRKEQENFIEQMRKQGCYAGFAKSVPEALHIIWNL